MARICVIGLGYIGLPTATAFAGAGHDVHGVDVNESVVETIGQGRIHIVEPGLEDAVAAAVAGGRLRTGTTPVPADAYILTVPTPLTADKRPDMSLVWRALDDILPHLENGNLVVLESTSPPGSTEELQRRIVASRPDLSGVFLAHAPERVLPGNIIREIRENDRIIGGITDEAGAVAEELYRSFVTGAILRTDATTAELVKLSENSFRDVNIAFANELSGIADHLGVDVWEVIRLANHHPRVNIMQPGPGVGGHCIAVDPWFIVDAAPAASALIETARRVNDNKPGRVIAQITDAITARGARSVLLLGLAFKANVDDLRESPSVEMTKRLAHALPDITVRVAEPHITQLPAALRDAPNVEFVADVDAAVRAEDVVALLVDHEQFTTITAEDIAGKAVIDTRGSFARASA